MACGTPNSNANHYRIDHFEKQPRLFLEDGQSHTRTPLPCMVEADFCENLRRNKLRPASDIPPLRFNNTPEEKITVEAPQ